MLKFVSRDEKMALMKRLAFSSNLAGTKAKLLSQALGFVSLTSIKWN